MTSLDVEKSKQSECVWMGAQQDLKDSNEVIEGWVSITHTHLHVHIRTMHSKPKYRCVTSKTSKRGARNRITRMKKLIAECIKAHCLPAIVGLVIEIILHFIAQAPL